MNWTLLPLNSTDDLCTGLKNYVKDLKYEFYKKEMFKRNITKTKRGTLGLKGFSSQ